MTVFRITSHVPDPVKDFAEIEPLAQLSEISPNLRVFSGVQEILEGAGPWTSLSFATRCAMYLAENGAGRGPNTLLELFRRLAALGVTATVMGGRPATVSSFPNQLTRTLESDAEYIHEINYKHFEYYYSNALSERGGVPVPRLIKDDHNAAAFFYTYFMTDIGECIKSDLGFIKADSRANLAQWCPWGPEKRCVVYLNATAYLLDSADVADVIEDGDRLIRTERAFYETHLFNDFKVLKGIAKEEDRPIDPEDPRWGPRWTFSDPELLTSWRRSSRREMVDPQRVDKQQSSKSEEAPSAPAIGLMLRNAQRVYAESTKVRGPLVDEVRDFINPYIGKRYDSFHDNKALADTIMRMVEDSGLQLYHEGQKVYLACAERKGSKYGTFEVVIEGTSKKIKQVTTLPALTVGLKESGQAEEQAKGKKSPRRSG